MNMTDHSILSVATRPAPLTPADCDLQDFAFMPLDVARLRDSELASNETPEACWAAVLLWAASWHQIPAASMPNDDKWIAKTAGYAQRGKIDRAWQAIRAGALRGWVECDDGRLYHPVVAEKAREAWQAKLRQRWGTECARIKKHNDRHETSIPKPTFEEWMADGCPTGQPLFVPRDKPPCPGNVPGETPSKGQGEGQGQGDIPSEAIASAGGPAVDKSATKVEKAADDVAKAEVWRAAVSVLEHGGCPAAQCRTFMGKLVGDYTFPVVQQAVAAAATAQPAEAREYLKAACQRIAGERHAMVNGRPLSFHDKSMPPPTVPSVEPIKTAAYLAGLDAHMAEVKASRGKRKPIPLPTKETT